MCQQRWSIWLGCLCSYFVLSGLAHGHGSKIGALVIEHPYAVEQSENPGEYAVYFKELKNTGTTADSLQTATTPVAKEAIFRTETHSVDHEGDRFEMVLTFEQAGPVKVVVWVQKPRVADKKHQH